MVFDANYTPPGGGRPQATLGDRSRPQVSESCLHFSVCFPPPKRRRRDIYVVTPTPQKQSPLAPTGGEGRGEGAVPSAPAAPKKKAEASPLALIFASHLPTSLISKSNPTPRRAEALRRRVNIQSNPQLLQIKDDSYYFTLPIPQPAICTPHLNSLTPSYSRPG
jgi:hypothetical protein